MAGSTTTTIAEYDPVVISCPSPDTSSGAEMAIYHALA
jgi:hypothetical protein